ncbi:cytochrome P450 [Streptomyces sp. NPDC091387]|uniref:cytochrome P450 n=1 Tax=Streptomyces sp. NPDC091387 TaxID=3365998 RepID=UPI00381AD284
MVTLTARIAPGASPLVGHLPRLLRAPLAFQVGLLSGDPVVRVRLGLRDLYVVTRPDVARKLLVSSDDAFDLGGPFFDSMRLIFGNGLGTCSNADQRRLRPLMNPAFRMDQMPGYANIMREQVSALARTWESGQVVEVGAQMKLLTTRVLTSTLLTSEHAAPAVAEMTRALPLVMPGLYWRMIIPMPGLFRLPTPSNRRFNEARNSLLSACDQAVSQYRSAGTGRSDLLSNMMEARGKDGDALDDRELRDQISTLIFAGAETASSLLTWAIHLISNHPAVERKLWAEVDEVLRGHVPEFHELPDLPYTQRILNEALRLFPPLWMFTMVTTAEAFIAGHRIPVGSHVLLPIYALHRDPSVFADPETFDPDRWLPERVGPAQRQGHLGFGAGARKCIGDNFAMIESTITLAGLAGRFRFIPHGNKRVEPKLRTALSPTACPMRVHLRTAR